MAKGSKTLQTNGNDGSESMNQTTSEPSGAGDGIVRLKSLVSGGGDHPGTGLSIPPSGEIFEADAERGAALILCGLAEAAPKGAKGE